MSIPAWLAAPIYQALGFVCPYISDHDPHISLDFIWSCMSTLVTRQCPEHVVFLASFTTLPRPSVPRLKARLILNQVGGHLDFLTQMTKAGLLGEINLTVTYQFSRSGKQMQLFTPNKKTLKTKPNELLQTLS